MNLTVFLNLHNQAAFDAAVDKLYDPESATYGKWMTEQDLEKFAPTSAEIKMVEDALAKQGLSVVSVGPNRFSLRVRGSAGNVQQAFQTELRNFTLNGKNFRAHIQDPKLAGLAGNLVSTVAGLDEHTVKPFFKRATNPTTGRPPSPIAVSKAIKGSPGDYITDNCLQAPTVETYTTPGASLPVGVYFGNVYNPVNAAGQSLVCAFTAKQLQGHYGLPAVYKAGYDGTGTTILLLEAYGYPSMLADANAYSAFMGLPALTSSTFKIVYPDGVPNPTLGALTGWDVEIALDIQMAHTAAPGAEIVVVVSNGQDSQDFESAMNYIIAKKLGSIVSDSWGEDIDLLSGPAEQDGFNNVLKLAAAQGISFNFSSGDSGDEGLGTPIGAPSVPSNSPYATAIGGTTILKFPNTGGAQTELGWGNDVTYIALGGVLDPPEPLGFIGGAGGGESVYFKKPAWQSKLPGTGRQVPDVSALADPYTGVAIVVTTANAAGQQEQQLIPGIGGTSLASPLFSGIWALATERAGHSLGLAGPKIASMPGNAVKDVLPVTSPTNLSGTVVDSLGPVYYSPSALFAPFLYTTIGFVSADYPLGPGAAADFAFGMDSSLTVTVGWDNVTGFGSPYGLAFIDAAAK